MSLKASNRSTCLPAPEHGQSLLELPAGVPIENSGLAPARASRIARRGKDEGQVILGICGPTVFASSVPEGPLSSWESRLRERLAMVGSTECDLIWRAKVTPAGRLMSRLAASTRRISETASSGLPSETIWPTPSEANATGGESSRSGSRKDEALLGGLMRQAPWPTVLAQGDSGPDFAKQERSSTGLKLETMLVQTDPRPWSTPTVTGNSNRRGSSKDAGDGVATQMRDTALWTTPQVHDGKSANPQRLGRSGTMHGTRNLNDEMAAWVTPSARDWKDSAGMAKTGGGGRSRLDQLPRQMAATDHSGQPPNGCSVTTGKRGAPNPIFAFWLMGYPDEFLCGVLQGIQSLCLSRSKLSKR